MPCSIDARTAQPEAELTCDSEVDLVGSKIESPKRMSICPCSKEMTCHCVFQLFPTHWLSTSLGKQFLWLPHIPQYTFSLVSLVSQEKRLKNFWSSGFLIPRSISLIKSSRVCTRELVSVKSLGLASWAITTGEASSLTTVSRLEKGERATVGVSVVYNLGFCPPDSLSQIFTQKKLFTYCVFDNEFKRWCPCIEWKDHCKYFRKMSDQNCQISSDGFASHVTSGHDLFNLSIETRPLQMFLPRQTGWDQQMSYTWASDRWVMPAPYYTTTVVYADLGHPGDVDLKFVF